MTEQYPQQGQGVSQLTPSDENTWCGLAHLGGIVLGFLAPLIVMLTKGNESPRVRAQAVEALNFQISVTLYAIVAGVLAFVLVGFLLLAALAAFQLVLMVIASVHASQGDVYRYPLTIRLI